MRAPVLLPSQTEAAVAVSAALRKYGVALDVSGMGAGKTYTTLWQHIVGGYAHLVVVCPAAVRGKWDGVAAHHGVTNISTISFAGLRLATCTPYLRRDGDAYAATAVFQAMAKAGVLLVCDEAQHLKNDSGQTWAFAALVKACTDAGTAVCRPSAVLLLSATPFEEKRHIATLLKVVLGGDTGRRAAARLMAMAMAMDPGCADRIRRAVNTSTPAGVARLGVRLYLGVFQRFMAVAMGVPPTAAELRSVQVSYAMARDDEAQLEAALTAAEVVVARLKPGSAVAIHGGPALARVEAAKVPLFVRLVVAALAAHATSKVVVALNYRRSVEAVCREVAAVVGTGCRVECVDGRVTGTRRTAALEAFQLVGGPCRVLVANVAVVDTGLDLDDKTGEEPRLLLVSPNHRVASLHQLTGRVRRASSVGVAHAVLVFGQCAAKEVSVLRALAAKSRILAATLPTQVKGGVLFPGEYPTYAECGEEEAHTHVGGIPVAPLPTKHHGLLSSLGRRYQMLESAAIPKHFKRPRAQEESGPPKNERRVCAV